MRILVPGILIRKTARLYTDYSLPLTTEYGKLIMKYVSVRRFYYETTYRPVTLERFNGITAKLTYFVKNQLITNGNSEKCSSGAPAGIALKS